MRSLATLIFIAIFTAYALTNTFVAMLMYWWFGIFRPHEWMWWNVSSLRLPLMAAGIFLIAAIFRGVKPSLSGAVPKLLFALVSLATVSSLLNGCDFPNPVNAKTAVVIFIVTIYSAALVDKPHRLFIFLAVVGLSLYAHSGKTGLLSIAQGKSLYAADIGGGAFTGTNAMSLGTAMGFFFLMLAVQCLRRPHPVYLSTFVASRPMLIRAMLVVLYLSMLGGLGFVFGTNSRGSALAFAIGLMIWILLHPNTLKIGLILLLLGSTVISVTGLPEDWISRIQTAFVSEEERDNSAASRPHFWNTAAKMTADNPIGVGVGCYQTFYNVYDSSDGAYGTFRSVHSSHFAILAEVGYAGVLVWFLTFVISAINLFKIRSRCMANENESPETWMYRQVAQNLLCVLTVFVIGGSFYEMPYNDYVWILFGAVIALTRLANNIPADGLDSAAALLGNTHKSV